MYDVKHRHFYVILSMQGCSMILCFLGKKKCFLMETIFKKNTVMLYMNSKFSK